MMLVSIKRTMKRLWRNECGAAMIELGFAMPIARFKKK